MSEDEQGSGEEPHVQHLEDHEYSILEGFRRTNKTLGEKLTGPLGSFLLHVVVLLLLFKFLVFKQENNASPIDVQIIEPVVEEQDPPEPEEPPEVVEDLPDIVEPVVSTEVTVNAPTEVEVSSLDQADFELTTALNIIDVASPVKVTGLKAYSQRSKAGREAAVRQYGGDKRTEAAVMKALRWLKDNQEPDGSWRTVKEAMTGMALLTFLAHGETPESEEFGETVRKGIQFLLSNQKENGKYGARAYTHGIATYAMAEAYGLTRIPDLKYSMEKALDVIIDGQNEHGSFDYGYKKGGRSDLSVAGWQYQAFKAGKMAGAELDRLDDALELSVKGLKHHSNGTGFGYGPNSASPSMTSVGALCMQLLGHGKANATQAGLEYLKTAVKDGWEGSSQYAWYYATQAKFHEGGKEWKRWNRMMKKELIGNQEEDGHWEAEVHGAGPVFSTTLCALQLMVYYRFLPSFQKEAIDTFNVAAPPPPDDAIKIAL